MIYLRQLEEKDAPLMLEWMHDSEFQKCFKRNILDTSLEDAISFCKRSIIPAKICNQDSLHFAISDDSDEYLGTISLKNINLIEKTAEYAISTRAKTHGTGVAGQATYQILCKAFFEYGLNKVYLNVYPNNVRAAKFYEKCGFIADETMCTDNTDADLKWYSMLEKDFNEENFKN